MQLYPLLQTKLYVPPVRRELVSRPRLIEQLTSGRNRALTLLSAPAGFGKTTLVSEWVRALARTTPPVASAWLSLDEGDNDPARFLAYLIAGLRSIKAGLAEGVRCTLLSPQPPATREVLTILINELATVRERVVLVLDGYHLIEAQPIHDALTFLLKHLPPLPGGLHLVILTRKDPHLPVARLHARGQLAAASRGFAARFHPTAWHIPHPARAVNNPLNHTFVG